MHFAGASLHALPKKHGGLRPIAVGETLRRLVSKLLCGAVRAEARRHLWPLQLGVAVPNGAEAAVHVTRQWSDRNALDLDKVVLRVDFCNAFNTVCRGSLLREVRARFPGLACWADWCYSSPSTLRFGQHKLQSCCGVQQGDPLGPLLFALALHPALRAAARHPVELCFSYLDDVVLAGRSDAVQAAFRDLQAAAAAAGLVVEVSKCVLVPTAGQASCVDASAFPAGLNTRQDGNFELLGAPIDPEFCESYTAVERVDKSAACLAALGDLEDSQTGLLLLRYCSSFSRRLCTACAPRPRPLSRPPCSASTRGSKPASSMLGACRSRTGPGSRPPSASEMVVLDSGKPPSSPAAYLASVGFSTAWCQELDARYATDWPTTTASVERFNAAVLAADRITAATVRPPRQQDLSASLDRAQLAQLSVSASGEAERAHGPLLSGSAPHAAPAPCCKHRWLLPTVRRDCRPLRGPRPPVRVGGTE